MKTLIFSHESDIDGLGNIVLAKKAFKEINYILSPSVASLEKVFREHLEDGSLNAYDQIFITDLALANPALEMVAQNEALRKKILIFDHHITSINDKLDIYDFTRIIDENEKGKRCGTDLFYEYLTKNGLLKPSSILDDFVELTRLEDTWEWKETKERGQKAHDLATLLNVVGIEGYINSMLTKVNSTDSKITFTPEEQAGIEKQKREYLALLESLWEDAEFFKDENGNPYAILLAEYKYRNEIAEYVRSLEDIKGIKYIIIVALEKGLAGQKSYRSIEDDFDVNVVAEAHGGGGHPKASSVNITPEQKEKALTLNKKDGLKYLADSKFN